MQTYSQKIIKPWGYEIIFTPPRSPVVGKIIQVKAGCRWSYQYHDQKEETFCLFRGQATITFENKEIPMIRLKGYHIRPMIKHRIKAVSDCFIFEASTPEKGNTVRLQDDYSRPTETEEVRKSPNRGWKGRG